MRLALLSDIHGNLPALLAVVADMARQRVDGVINLGDSLSGPLYPEETACWLRQRAWLHLAGNHERQLLAVDEHGGGASDRYARACLQQASLDWIASLSDTCRYNDEVFFCHGTPRSDLEYWLETVTPQGLRMATLAEIEERRAGVKARLMACGHTHIPRVVRLPDGCLVVNPGSVGLPAYDDDQPFDHVVETGAPDARYAIVERGQAGWSASLLAVPYDAGPLAALAASRGRPDWAVALASGFMQA